ncbi:putative transport protein HsrA [Pseudovibrio axinellae]|uniref:Putative transport protein HsrA n=1 Tax=Pseudovibrio axinellae TaxID=989403 RepID=A0A166ABB3_9HYPH|nr:MFS transporter [Pseudovibrio axinellae]KZL20824.1 putative transport protein HsrA [Pseudovibrio axinellae]SER21428.1 Major Facilitator Superfamily protein [Pseudovibrio axinellae]
MPRRLRITTLIVGMTLLLVQVDAMVLAIAIPRIAQDFHTNPLYLHLTISLYQLTLAVFIPISGWAADRVGSKRLFVWSCALFLSMSIACALSKDLTSLLLARSVQGASGAFLMAIGRLTVIRMAGSQNLVAAMVWIVTPAAFGFVFGPFLGSLVINFLSWRWIFLINVPVCIAIAVMSSYYFRNLQLKEKVPLDFLGFILLGGFASLLLFTISALPDITRNGFISASLLAASLLCGLAFVGHIRRSPHPLIDLQIFANVGYRLATGVGVLLRMGASSFAFVAPLMLQILLGFDVMTTGVLMGFAAAGGLLSRAVVHPLIKRNGFRRILQIFVVFLGFATLAIGFVWLANWIVIIALVILSGGFFRGLVFTATNTACYADLPVPLVNHGVSFAGLSQQLSNSLAVGVAAAVLHVRQGITGHSVLTGPDFGWLAICTSLFVLVSLPLVWFLPSGMGKR